MFANGGVREYLKHTVSVARVKLLYERITLNRFIMLYFFSALLACFVLTSLQIVSLAHDSEGVSALSSVIAGSPRLPGIAVLQGDSIELCSGLPKQVRTVCIHALEFRNGLQNTELGARDDDDNEDENDEDEDEDDLDPIDAKKNPDDDDHHGKNKIDITLTPIGGPVPSSTSLSSTSVESTTSSVITQTSTISATRTADSTTFSPPSTSTAIAIMTSTLITSTSSITSSAPIPIPTPERSTDDSSELQEECIISIMWLNDVLHDARREDIVLFVFQIWLLVLSFVTILNESIPHLGAGLLGHVLGTAWAAYRIHSAQRLMNRYRDDIVPNACNGRDFMGDWWESSIRDAIPLVVFQAITLFVVSYLSFKLFRVYAHQTFKRAGASSKVNSMYKLVLMFSVWLQLSAFISIASAGMWIDKVSHGALAGLAKHANIYLAAFILTLVLQVPWLIIGWMCVRLECRIRFFIFCLISAMALTLSIAMFASDIYRYIFSTWPFFATITITAFVLLVGTTVLGILCRLNFGQGLAHYLQVTEALEGVDFSPVYFTNDSKNSDIEKTEIVPQLTRLTPDGRHVIEFPVPVYAPKAAGTRGISVYSDPDAPPILLSSSPPLESDLISNNRSSIFSRALKRISSRGPSVRSQKVDPANAGNSAFLSPDTTSRSVKRTSGQSEMVGSITGSRISPPSSPMETLSVLSHMSNQPTIVSDRFTDRNPNNKGLPANTCSRIIS